MYFNDFANVVPKPSVNITILNDQTVGQSLTLECSITTVRGITSRVDIVWSSNGIELKRIERFNHTSMAHSSVQFSDIYTIPQLSTMDKGRVLQCDILINGISLVTASNNITLNVIGK